MSTPDQVSATRVMRLACLITIAALTLVLPGCGGGTYVDDQRNFERAFQVKCPVDVQVVHSVYTQTAHFTEEHKYFFQMKPAAGSDIFKSLTSIPGTVQSTNGLAEVSFYLNLPDDRPAWFATNTLTHYDIWYNTNTPFVVLRDKADTNIFVYGSVGM